MSMASPPSSSSVASTGNETIAGLHSDIIRALILRRLDGPNLASTACVSSHLRSLSTEENLWRDIVIPRGLLSINHLNVSSLPIATELISAVDIYYQGIPICSKVLEMETTSNWFLSSPFRAELLGPNDPAPVSPIKHGSCNDVTWLKHLEENLSLSWIVIDARRKKAVSMSSERAVWVQRHWLTGNVQARFGTVMEGDEGWGSSKELVECGVVVTCGEIENEGEEMHVREVSMRMEDMDGKGLSGAESLVILQRGMESRRSWKSRKGKGGKVEYQEFEERKRRRQETNGRNDRILDSFCILSIFAVCGAFCFLILSI
ncbi:putative F-box family protein [Hibiscus syriacus]|uniref:F-box family protein n=1 Tax=Hibiscus syriacus TaxID=106335 RepID=A0A6A3CZ03_HIBSY|nr:putative F-box family protein [Hibiscus syriacus]